MSEYFVDACTFGVAEFKDNIKVRILNLNSYYYLDGKRRMRGEWLWERGAEYEVRNTGKNSFNASDENIFLIACAIPYYINTAIDEYMVCIGKTEQGKTGSSSRLYIDKHTVFTNYITQTEFYMGKNLLYLFRTPLVENDIRVSVQRFADSCESIYSMLAG